MTHTLLLVEDSPGDAVLIRRRLEEASEESWGVRHAGRGLGLSAALGIARQHGGAISIESVEPKGTAVCVLFPPQRDDEQGGPAPSDEEPS